MRKYRNSSGIAHPGLIVLVVAVVAVAGFAFWKVSSGKDSSTSSSTTKVSKAEEKAAQTACEKSINDKDFCKFASHTNIIKDVYVATDTSVTADGTSTMVIKSDGKNNTDMTISQGGVETARYISLDGATYMKTPDSDVWTKYPASSTAAPKDTSPTSDIKVDYNNITENNTVSYKNLGKEACDKLTCFKYQVVDTTNAGTTQYIFFDTKDYLMRKWSSKDSSGSNDMVFTYPSSVTITAPTPVQEFSLQFGKLK